MTDAQPAYGDPLTRPFWEAAERHELAMPRCVDCARVEWYPRPFCLSCGGRLAWERLSGIGRIYSVTTVHVEVVPGLQPPYVVAIVELDEGPRMLTTIQDGTSDTAIGDRVVVAWQNREDAPPLPVFRSAAAAGR